MADNCILTKLFPAFYFSRNLFRYLNLIETRRMAITMSTDRMCSDWTAAGSHPETISVSNCWWPKVGPACIAVNLSRWLINPFNSSVGISHNDGWCEYQSVLIEWCRRRRHERSGRSSDWDSPTNDRRSRQHSIQLRCSWLLQCEVKWSGGACALRTSVLQWRIKSNWMERWIVDFIIIVEISCSGRIFRNVEFLFCYCLFV